ncbi:hypothetical protein ACQ4LE_001378 [Meloidogyne hapla]
MTSDSSPISTEDEFVYLNRPKTKEIGTMTVKMDLIPKAEIEDVNLIIVLKLFNELVKELFNKLKNGAIIAMDWLWGLLKFVSERFKELFNKSKNGAIISIDWISHHFLLVFGCLSVFTVVALFYLDCLPPTKYTIVIIYSYLMLSLGTSFFILLFIFILTVFWYMFSSVIQDNSLGSGSIAFAIAISLLFVVILSFYFSFLYQILMAILK